MGSDIADNALCDVMDKGHLDAFRVVDVLDVSQVQS